MRKTIPTLLALLCLGAQSEAALTTAVSPNSGDLTIIDGSDAYLTFAYYEWGPSWSGTRKKNTVTEGEGRADFTIDTELNNKVTYSIAGAWSQPESDNIRFDATLTPAGTSDITLSQFGLTMGAAFAGTEAIVTFADGTTSTIAVPLPRGEPGSNVKRIEFKDTTGRVTVISFDAPTHIPSDRGDARIALAHEHITEGQDETLNFTIQLPESTVFIPGAEAATQYSDISDWYGFSPADSVSDKSEWNLSSWLETPAGKHGRITQKEDQLIYNNAPIKLWGINNCYGTCAPDNALADKRADFYAALGINTIRLHKYAQGDGWAGVLAKGSATEYDADALDKMDYYIAALKKRGIYTKLSPVFMVELTEGERERVPYIDEFGAMSYGRINTRHGAFYLSTELQDILADQVTNLLKHKNPYTGLTYAEDPAIAYVEIFNEDSALWGGVTGTMKKSATLRARGGEMFAQWLKKKYNNDEDAFKTAWGEGTLNCNILNNQGLPTDESWADNRIYPAGNPWFFDPTNLDGSQKQFRRRLLDTIAFLNDLQVNVYKRYTSKVREAGYTGEMITSNWQAGRMMSHFYNLHTDAITGTIDRHNYFGGGAHGSATFAPRSMLTKAGSGTLSTALQQVDNCAFMLSEWIHVMPNEWGVEGAAIVGAYGMGLQGWDVSYAFQNRDTGNFSSAIGTDAWEASAPQFLGIFPAVSRQVLRGDVKESTVVHHRNVNLAALDQGKVGFDEITKQQHDVKTFTSDVFPAAAIAVAKTVVSFTDSFEPTEQFDLEAYRKDGVLTSSTKQLRWKEGDNLFEGHIEINTPGTQAVVGFADGQKIEFDDAIIKQHGLYSAIYLSAQSRNGTIAKDDILISAISRARNEGSIIVANSILVSKGEIKHHKPQGPVVMEPVVAEIAVKRRGNPTVHILDHTGVKTGKTVPVKNGYFTIDTGRDASPYYLISY